MKIHNEKLLKMKHFLKWFSISAVAIFLSYIWLINRDWRIGVACCFLYLIGFSVGYVSKEAE